MGAWGPAIFSDDVACDVRNSYKELIADGVADEVATDQLVAQWLTDLEQDEDEDAIVFWLALAATQSTLGRLEDRVRDRAVALIDSGRDLDRWEETGLAKKRQQHLEKLRKKLLGPQPKPKKPRVERFYVPEFSTGQFIGYRLNSGRLVLFHVEGRNDQSCAFTALDWCGDEFPTADEIGGLPQKTPLNGPGSRTRPLLFELYTQKRRGIPHDRLTVLDIPPVAPEKEYDGGGFFWEWGESLDKNLAFYFNWT